ncbi:MAG TPA: hypothetical protein VK505_03520, partial [Steroidobacteraceae bacterium]|nr:hypothetical protein [Steroidobacteraceae bacterium]
MKFRRACFSYAVLLVCCSAALAQPAAQPAPAAVPYLSSGQVNSVALLGPPPAAGSEAAAADLKAVRAEQRAAHAEGTIERAEADNQASCGRVADVLH